MSTAKIEVGNSHKNYFLTSFIYDGTTRIYENIKQVIVLGRSNKLLWLFKLNKTFE